MPRPALVRRLRQAPPVVVVTAPVGYGKTDLLRRWAAADSRHFAWLSLNPSHDHPLVLLADVLTAADESEAMGRDLLAGPLEDAAFLEAVTLPRLAARWASRSAPQVLVLENIDVLRSTQARRIVAAVCESIPLGSQVVLSGRGRPALPVARWAARHHLLWLRADDLAMTPVEARALLEAEGVHLTGAEVTGLVRRTEGWPAMLGLAAEMFRWTSGAAGAVQDFCGAHPLVSSYLHEEVLAGLSPDLLAFLERTSILQVLDAELCDAVLGEHGSGARLSGLVAAHVPITLDPEQAGRFRCHPLLRDLLASELEQHEPENVARYHRRAAEELQRRGDIDAALHHAQRSGQISLVADGLWKQIPAEMSHGRRARVERWLHALPERELLARPNLAVAMGWCALEAGRPVDLWAAAAARGASAPGSSEAPSSAAAALLLKGAMGADGLAAMETDGTTAYAMAAPSDPFRSLACYVAGTARHLRGDAVGAAKWLDEGEQLSRMLDVPTVRALCLGRQAFMAFEGGDRERTRSLATRAVGVVDRHDLAELPTMVPVLVMAALDSAQGGYRTAAERLTRPAERLLGLIGPRVRWLDVESRVLLARAHLLLGDPRAARSVLADPPGMRAAVADSPLLLRLLDEVLPLIGSASPVTVLGPNALTTAELRVLQLLPTHLSFREIGEALFLSRNTVKTQAIAAYRKLGATSRGEAVEAARALGLLVPPPTLAAG